MAADVNSNLASWSTSEASNSPSGSTAISTNLDDNLRTIQAVVRKYLATKGSDLASGTTTDLSTTDGNFIDITGTTTITGFGTLSAGMWKVLQFDGALTLTHNATSLILPTGANITTVAGDCCFAYSLGAGNWIVPFYQQAGIRDSAPIVFGSADATKKLRLEVDGITTATTRVLTAPDYDGTIATLAGTETFTNKTLTTPTLTSPVINTGVTGTAIASIAQQQTGTAVDVLVTPGRQGSHLTAAKAWVRFNGAGVVSIASSYNVTSVSDGGTGAYTVNFTSALTDTNYSIACAAGDGAGGNVVVICPSASAPTVSALSVGTKNNSFAAVDVSYISVIVFGN